MNDDWQVGDLALCVDNSPKKWQDSRSVDALKQLQVGHIYRVIGLSLASTAGIILEGVEAANQRFGAGWLPTRFRKIRPDSEPCEEEFVTLIKRMKPAKVMS